MDDIADTVPLETRVDEFYRAFAPNWGPLDVTEAVSIAREAGFHVKELEDYVREYVSSTGISDRIDEIDVAGLAYEMVFEHARNLIDDVLGIDIEDEGYRVVADYVASCFDFENNGCVDTVIDALKGATPDQIRRIRGDRPTVCFLSHVDDLKAYMERVWE